MPSASRRDPTATQEEVDGELLTVYRGDTLDAAMAAAAAGHGPAPAVRRARRVKQGVRGLLGRERFEVLVAGDPLPGTTAPAPATRGPAAPPPTDVASALDLLLEQADAAEDRAAGAAGAAGGLRRRPPAAAAPSRPPARPEAPPRTASAGAPPPAAATAGAAAGPPPRALRAGPAADVDLTATPAAGPAADAGTRGRAGRPRTAEPAPPVVPRRAARAPQDVHQSPHPDLDIAAHDPTPPEDPPLDAAPGRPVVRPSRYGRRAADRGLPEPAGAGGHSRRAGDVLDAEVVEDVEEVVGASGRRVPRGPQERSAPAVPESTRAGATGPRTAGRAAGRGTPAAARAASPASAAAASAAAARATPAAPAAREAGADAPRAAGAAAPRRSSAHRPAAGDGWSRAALKTLGVPPAVLSRLPAEEPDDDLGWLAALGAAIAAVVPPPADPSPEHPVVVSGHGLEGAVALLEAGVSGVAPGTITVGDRTVPATAAELALVVRSWVLT